MQQELRGCMVELRGVHRADQAQFIGDPTQLREQVAQFHAALSALAEAMQRTQQLRMPLDEGEPLALQVLIGAGCAVQSRQLGLVVIELELRWTAGQVHVDHGLGASGEMRAARRDRVDLAIEQRCRHAQLTQRQRTEPQAPGTQELASRDRMQTRQVVSHHGRLRNSSVFRMALATLVKAARCTA